MDFGMEPVKKNKSSKILIIVLVILLIALGSHTVYDKLVLDINSKEKLKEETKKYNDLNKNYKDIKKENEKLNKELESVANKETKDDNNKNYLVFGPTTVFSEKMNVYGTTGTVTAFAKDGDIYFTDTYLKHYIDQSETKKSSIKEKDVSKIVFSWDEIYTLAFVIYKDGRVKLVNIIYPDYHHESDENSSSSFKLEETFLYKGYKVKDLEVRCKYYRKVQQSCTKPITKLILQDGSSKTVSWGEEE